MKADLPPCGGDGRQARQVQGQRGREERQQGRRSHQPPTLRRRPMVAQKGKDLLLKIDSNGLGNFVTVAGLRSKRIAFNSETVDITDADSAGRWRELLAGSGVQRAAISGSGIFKD